MKVCFRRRIYIKIPWTWSIERFWSHLLKCTFYLNKSIIQIKKDVYFREIIVTNERTAWIYIYVFSLSIKNMSKCFADQKKNIAGAKTGSFSIFLHFSLIVYDYLSSVMCLHDDVLFFCVSLSLLLFSFFFFVSFLRSATHLPLHFCCQV